VENNQNLRQREIIFPNSREAKTEYNAHTENINTSDWAWDDEGVPSPFSSECRSEVPMRQ